MPQPDEKEEVFEDFAPGGNADIFAKVSALSGSIGSNPHFQDYELALGVQMLGPASSRTAIREADGRTHEAIMLGSNSYLNLTTHPAVVAASKAACDKYGYGMGAVSLYAGTSDLHKRLEKMIAGFHGAEDAILFPCGYSANIGIISALCGPGDVIINDASNHASIFDGSALSGADLKIYLHNNMSHLERTLKRLPAGQKGRLIITDGVFSMAGDLAPLDRITELARRYGARVMVDDAHGLGIVGPTGRGTAEKFAVMDKIDINAGMLSKSPGGLGGYCAGGRDLVRYLRYYARTYFFSTSLPPSVVAGLIEVFRLLGADQAGRDRLWLNVNALLGGLKALGFNTGATGSAIIPVIIGDEYKMLALCNALRERGVYTNVVTYPAVRRKECRLRLCVVNTLTESDIRAVLTVFAELGRKYGLIP
ncbi:MAG TPA: aminotransferase class I/II-fold pyridoxal phosphate-dependent enzyme [Elusimicrobiales bacterium]|nr:aminotransferase class I/II-fold pyridoxal phosphate-dependent enzyme [Elusimicrobiales bacterium]